MELHGIELLTRDVERLVEFYRMAFCARREDSHGGPDRVELVFDNKGAGAALAITRNEHIPENGARHLCMEIAVANADAHYRFLCDNGIMPLCPPTDLPWGYRYFGVCDPDGNHISFVSKL